MNDDSTQTIVPEIGSAGAAQREAVHETNPAEVGEYQFLRMLGRGAMAIVYEAYCPLTRRHVALKVLDRELMRDPEAQRRIQREIAILERLHHRNIVQLQTHGQTPEGDFFLVFELIQGPTLKEIIARGEKTDWIRALDWMRDAALALDAAWSHHVIHRDIKPANMIIDADQTLKVGDFGLAKRVYEAEEKDRERIMMGTPRYLSPEMALGQSLDFRADMYSLGATFYHVFAGQPPFDAQTAQALAQRHASAPAPPLHSIVPHLPEDICDILMKLLKKDPEERYQSYADLIGDLKEARLALMARYHLEGKAESGSPHADLSAAVPSDALPIIDPEEVQDVHARLRAPLLILLVLAGVAALVSVKFYRKVETGLGEPGEKQGWVERQIRSVVPPSEEKSRVRIRVERIAGENRERMESVMLKVTRFELEKGRRPNTLRDLVGGGYLVESDLADAYANTLIYDPNEGTLISQGPDREAGGGDDFILDETMKWLKTPPVETLLERSGLGTRR